MIGYLKGKSSIWIAQNVERKLRNFLGHKFWARGYFVSTVGRDEEMIRAYIRNQEMADKQLDQMQLKLASSQSPILCPRILYNRLWRFPLQTPSSAGGYWLVTGARTPGGAVRRGAFLRFGLRGLRMSGCPSHYMGPGALRARLLTPHQLSRELALGPFGACQFGADNGRLSQLRVAGGSSLR